MLFEYTADRHAHFVVHSSANGSPENKFHCILCDYTPLTEEKNVLFLEFLFTKI